MSRVNPLGALVAGLLVLILGACAPGSDANTACHGFAAVVSAVGDPGKFVGAAIDGACDAQRFGPQATGPADPCRAVDGEDACQTCLRTKLCESLDDCGQDTACWCNVGCVAAEANGHGGPATVCAASNGCGAPDDTYHAAMDLDRVGLSERLLGLAPGGRAMIHHVCCAVALGLALVAGCGGSDMPTVWASNPFGPLLTLAERESEGSCYSPPSDDPRGCTPDIKTGACIPSAQAACAVSSSDSGCVACAKAWCCAPVLACDGSGATCACLVQARTDGVAAACNADITAADTYEEEAGCLAQHCAAPCPAFAGAR